MDIGIGDPLRSAFEQQWRDQAELLRMAHAVQALTRPQQEL
jgi:hypothetical protein